MARQTKNVTPKNIGTVKIPVQPFGHAEVANCPAGIRLRLTLGREDPKDRRSDEVLWCSVFDDKDREQSLGCFGGMFYLEPIPVKHRMAVYQLIAKAADLVGVS
jgi:hypothetical protein